MPTTFDATQTSYLSPLAGGVSRTLQSKLSDFYSVKDLGSIGDGAHATQDQTGYQSLVTAIMAGASNAPSGSWDYSNFQSGGLIEPGIYDVGGLILGGNGSNYPALKLVARIPGTVYIRIPAGQYFITVNGRVNSVEIDGIVFIGGKGAINFSNTSNNVNLKHRIQRCFFFNYTECSVQNNSNDHPYLEFIGNILLGAQGSSTVGLAWSGGLDLMEVRGNSFLHNAIHVIANGGTKAHIEKNDFIHWYNVTSNPTMQPVICDIWLVPVLAANANYGLAPALGFAIINNKFGNENQYTGAPRILIAQVDGTTGTTNGTYRPGTTDDGSWWEGLLISGNKFAGLSANNASIVKTTISKFHRCIWEKNQHEGATYNYVFEHTNGHTQSWIVGENEAEIRPADLKYGSNLATNFSNLTNPWCRLKDWLSIWPGDPNSIEVFPVSDHSSNAVIYNGISWRARLLGSGAIQVSTSPDPRGGIDYCLYQMTTSASNVYVQLLTGIPAAGCRVFVELMLASPGARGMPVVKILVHNNSDNQDAYKRFVNVPTTGFGRHIAIVDIPASASPTSWGLTVGTANGESPPGNYAFVAGTTDQFIYGDLIINTGVGRIGYQKAIETYPAHESNPTMLGGSTTTFPTGWSLSSAVSGISITPVKRGMDDTSYFMDVLISGTPGATATQYIFLEPDSTIGVASGNIQRFYMGLALVAGSTANFTSQTGTDGSTGVIAVDLLYRTSTGAYINDYTRCLTPGSSYTAVRGSDWAGAGSTAATLTPALLFKFTSGQAVNATFRIWQHRIRRVY